MQHFMDWHAAQADSRPWLILGKGPSFDKLNRFDTSGYRRMSLNHSVREAVVDVAHMIDIDVVEQCGQALINNAAVVVLPRFPHVKNRVGKVSLEQWVERIPLLKILNQEQRLLWYDLSTAKGTSGSHPSIEARWFSAEAALNLLVAAGNRTIRSLGVDGGDTYANSFEDLSKKTKLNNGHLTYNHQFRSFAKTLFREKVDFSPLDVGSPIRVFVGSQEEQALPVKVLEYSIRRNCSMSVEVSPLHTLGIVTPAPKDKKNRPRTPFSFQRFAIPELCGFKGRAIYLDSDMLVFDDLRQLWTLEMGSADLMAPPGSLLSRRKPQFSVMLMDCERLRWRLPDLIAKLDSGVLDYESLMFDMAVADHIETGIDPKWNSLESYTSGTTALLHYTDMYRQPWVSIRNPLGHLWVKALIEAVADQFISIEEIQESILRGWVRPSLAMQISRRASRLGFSLPSAWKLDRQFVAPYKL